jgi:hypothetical protein
LRPEGWWNKPLGITFFRQIQALDKQIDALVYGLYGLSEDEIKVVEGDI